MYTSYNLDFQEFNRLVEIPTYGLAKLIGFCLIAFKQSTNAEVISLCPFLSLPALNLT
jgi:hypothetical protein